MKLHRTHWYRGFITVLLLIFLLLTIDAVTSQAKSLPSPKALGNTCAVDYVIRNDWGTGATVDVTIHNNSPSHQWLDADVDVPGEPADYEFVERDAHAEWAVGVGFQRVVERHDTAEWRDSEFWVQSVLQWDEQGTDGFRAERCPEQRNTDADGHYHRHPNSNTDADGYPHCYTCSDSQ